MGQQPAATAVLLKSWVGESGPPDEVWLLATSHVERTGVAARLRAFCASVVPGTRCEVVPIASGLEDAAGRPSARTWVRDFLASREQRAQVIFAGDPGPSFIVAAVSRLLPRDATLLHADSDCVWAVQRWDGWEGFRPLKAAHLGRDVLPAFHALKAAESPTGQHPVLGQALARSEIQLLDAMRRSVVYPELPNTASLSPFEPASEACRRFYGVCGSR